MSSLNYWLELGMWWVFIIFSTYHIYFGALTSYYKKSTPWITKMLQNKLIFVCYLNIYKYILSSQYIILFLPPLSLHIPCPTQLSFHSPSIHPSIHLTSMHWVLTVNYTLDPGDTVVNQPWHLSSRILKSCEETGECRGTNNKCIITKESVLRKHIGGLSVESWNVLEEKAPKFECEEMWKFVRYKKDLS